MRIISGQLGGRIFESPHGHRTHPMSDKVRGALFNTLGDLGGLDILDPFGGSGAISFEAVSRGAKSAVVIDSDRRAQQTIASNIKKLELSEKIRLVKSNAGAWSRTNQAKKFNIVIADPPYDDTQEKLLEELVHHTAIGGLFVLSWPADKNFPLFSSLNEISRKQYGDAQLVFYKQVS